jgi:hypothetical protein
MGPEDDYEGKKILDFRRSDKNDFLFIYYNNYTDTFGFIFEIILNKRVGLQRKQKYNTFIAAIALR